MDAISANRSVYFRDLMLVLVGKELKARYKSTALGYVWSLLHPLLFAGVFFLVFRVFVRIDMENYALFLIAGLFPWQWFSNSLSASNDAFLSNSSLIKKVRFPRELLVLSGVVNDMIHFLVAIPVIVVFLLVFDRRPSAMWLWQVPVLTAITLALTYGVSLTVASCNLFFRDLERLTVIGVMFWFYLTPVLYPVDMIPPRLAWLVTANPMAPVILSWRDVFLRGTLDPARLGLAAVYAAAALVLGRAVYRALQWRFAEVV